MQLQQYNFEVTLTLLPCEIAMKCLLPSIRAAVADRLLRNHNLKQLEVAKLLGVSQSAISLYSRKIRGKAISLENDQEIVTLIDNLANAILNRNLACKDLIRTFCLICRTARAKGLLCQMHKNLDQNLADENCELCFLPNAIRCI